MLTQDKALSCSLSKLFDVLGQKRTLHIIKILESQINRFNDLKSQLGEISSNVLSQRLKQLEDEQIVTRTVSNTRPLMITYALSPKGKKISRILHELGQCE